MPSKTISTVNVEQALKAIAHLAKKSKQDIQAALFTSSEAILVPAVKQTLRREKRVFKGALISKISTAILPGRANPTIKFGAVGVKYGRIVEEGSAGRPISAQEFRKLVSYAKNKLGFRTKVPKRRVRRGGKGGKLTKFNFTAEQVAKFLKERIETRGNIAHPYIIPTWNANKHKFTKDFLRRLRKRWGFF